MPKITDPGELEIIKRIYGFEPAIFKGAEVSQQERDERAQARKRNQKNKSK